MRMAASSWTTVKRLRTRHYPCCPMGRELEAPSRSITSLRASNAPAPQRPNRRRETDDEESQAWTQDCGCDTGAKSGLRGGQAHSQATLEWNGEGGKGVTNGSQWLPLG